MPSSLLARLAAVALLFGLFGFPAVAEDQKYELGIQGGLIYLDESLAGSSGPTVEPTVGLRAAGPLPVGSLGWFADALYADIDTETFRLGAQSFAARGGLEWLHPDMYSRPLLLTLGLGYNNISFDEATDYSSMFVSAGVGQKYRLGGNRLFRWELRADHSLADEGLAGEDIIQPMLLVGLSWEFGRGKRREAPVLPESDAAEPEPVAGAPAEPQPDADSDGVPDADDRCPATLLGIDVDDNGCPRDEDGDGVYDGLGMDRCPRTPRGAVVDIHGCPLDGDGDGVYDGLDRCPESEPGAGVDAEGC
jgi:OOP family OmpA-OmpF porin